MRRRRWRSRALTAGVAVAALVGLAGCGAGPVGPPTLNWYINPDDGGQAEIAARCTAASGGAYRIEVSTLPNDASEQRQQLVRRLAANDSSIDIMSIDPPYIPEFAEAGFLAPMPADVAGRSTAGVVNSAVEGSTWRGRLVTVPFWANTQLFWYRKSMVAGSGLDPTKPVTWDQLVSVAQRKGKNLAAQGDRGESLTVWFNALVESGGGKIVTNPSPDDPKAVGLGLDSPAARKSAEIMNSVAGVAGPGFSTSDEEVNANAYQDDSAMFTVLWPSSLWGKVKSSVEEGSAPASLLADTGWGEYPRTDASRPSAPPYGGVNLGVGRFSPNPDLAYRATECITSPANQAYYFVSNGNPAVKESVYSDPEVLKEFPMAPLIRQSLDQAAPRPATAYYAEISESIQRNYHPPGAIAPSTVGPATAALIRAVLAKEKLL